MHLDVKYFLYMAKHSSSQGAHGYEEKNKSNFLVHKISEYQVDLLFGKSHSLTLFTGNVESS